jgi:hypothetical protein
MMVFYWHTPIVPDYVDMTFLDLARRKIPVTWIKDIRFFYLSAVNKKFSVTKFNPFALQSDHTF